jgi:hypothetical protein
MILAVISLIIVLTIVSLLFIPIDVYIDTRSNEYYAELKGLARASIEPDEKELFRIRVKIPFKNYYFFPLKTLLAPKKTGKQKRRKKGSKSANRFTPNTILRLMNSFKIKKWNVELDTGDCISNARLYPLFAFLDYRFGGFEINFEGRNHAMLMVRNRPIYLIKSFFNL